MQVSNSVAGAVAQAYASELERPSQPSGRIAPRDVGVGQRSDSVGLSQTAQELNRIRLAVNGSPDSRGDKMTRLKAALASGAYAVNSRALAGSLLAAGSA